jgi:hypothetical protein
MFAIHSRMRRLYVIDSKDDNVPNQPCPQAKPGESAPGHHQAEAVAAKTVP